MIRALQIAEDMRKNGVIEDYAIAGSVAVMFHTEPIDTEDFDIMVVLIEADKTGPIAGLKLMSHLGSLGYRFVKGHLLLIEGRITDYVVAATALEEEAVRKAPSVEVSPGVSSKVMDPEYLYVIARRVGRPKDLLKVDLLERHRGHDLDRGLIAALSQRFGVRP